MNVCPSRNVARTFVTVRADAEEANRRLAMRLAIRRRVVSRDRDMEGEPSWPIRVQAYRKDTGHLAICKQVSGSRDLLRSPVGPRVRQRRTREKPAPVARFACEKPPEGDHRGLHNSQMRAPAHLAVGAP